MKLQEQIISLLRGNPDLSSNEIHDKLEAQSSYSTTKRTLSKLVEKKLIDKSGNRKGTKYKIGESYSILHSIDVDDYFIKDIDDRKIKESFSFQLYFRPYKYLSVILTAKFARVAQSTQSWMDKNSL